MTEKYLSVRDMKELVAKHNGLKIYAVMYVDYHVMGCFTDIKLCCDYIKTRDDIGWISGYTDNFPCSCPTWRPEDFLERFDNEEKYSGPVEIVYYNGNVQKCNSLAQAREEMAYWGNSESYIRKPEERLS